MESQDTPMQVSQLMMWNWLFFFFLGGGGGGGGKEVVEAHVPVPGGVGGGEMVNTGATEDDEELSC